jgi:4,5-dihydroxyphthalate decarboxylase
VTGIQEESEMKLVVGRDDLAAVAAEAARESGAELERLDVRPVHKASRGFVNDASADVCEIAVVTLLQAVAYDKPVVLLPLTTLVRAQHQTLVTLGDLAVGDIEGKSAGVRSRSQTTGVWLRGFLTEQFGIDLREVEWTVYEDAHVDAYQDPAWVRRAPEGARLQADFLEGRLDFGVMGNELPDDARIHTAIPDARDVAAEWSARKGFTPVNHVIGVNVDAAKEHSAAICAIYDAISAVSAQDSVGFGALRAPLSLAAAYALEQEVLPRAVDFDELVAQSCAALGVSPSRLGG